MEPTQPPARRWSFSLRAMLVLLTWSAILAYWGTLIWDWVKAVASA